MQIGDPKKTALLGTVAVGALLFLGSRVMSLRGDVPKALRRATSTELPGQGTMVTSTIEQLHADPFSHPKLAPHFPGNSQTQATPNLGGNGKADPPGDYAPIFVPGGPNTSIDKVPPADWPNSTTPGDKTPATTTNSTPPAESLTKVTLKAIFKVDQRTAYLEIDGSEPRAYHIGDLIKDDLVIVMINDDSVILKNSKRTLTLRMGQQGDL